MKNTKKGWIISIVVVLCLYSLLNQTGVLRTYTIPTTSNEPGIHVNSRIASSNIVDYERGDFVCYKRGEKGNGKRPIWAHRLMGIAGDTIEIKDGVIFVNGKNVDSGLELFHTYLLDKGNVNTLRKGNVELPFTYRINKEITGVDLSDKVAKEYDLEAYIQIEPKEKIDKNIKRTYNQDWNRDHLGPIEIPEGKCFVVGDNRGNSLDSRYFGFVDESDIIGTVVYK